MSRHGVITRLLRTSTVSVKVRAKVESTLLSAVKVMFICRVSTKVLAAAGYVEGAPVAVGLQADSVPPVVVQAVKVEAFVST